MKISNLTSPSGNPVPNQFLITEYGNWASGNFVRRDTFQSYQSIIVIQTFWAWGETVTVLDEKYWDYSRTTGKYRNQFLWEDKKETEKKIKSWEYKLSNLNK